MSKWITKSKVKEAEQFFSDRMPLPFHDEGACCIGPGGWYVITTHGQETAIEDGDFIVREPDNNGFYPCKPEIWLAGHEPIEQIPLQGYVAVYEEHLRDGTEDGAKVFIGKNAKEQALEWINKLSTHSHNCEYYLFKLGKQVSIVKQTIEEPQPAKATIKYV